MDVETAKSSGIVVTVLAVVGWIVRRAVSEFDGKATRAELSAVATALGRVGSKLDDIQETVGDMRERLGLVEGALIQQTASNNKNNKQRPHHSDAVNRPDQGK